VPRGRQKDEGKIKKDEARKIAESGKRMTEELRRRKGSGESE
jgi:hypothetical protein